MALHCVNCHLLHFGYEGVSTMNLFAVIITADYEFLGHGSSGGYEKMVVGFVLSKNKESAKKNGSQ